MPDSFPHLSITFLNNIFPSADELFNAEELFDLVTNEDISVVSLENCFDLQVSHFKLGISRHEQT